MYLHLSLRAADLDASVKFYSQLFDLAPDKLHADYARFTVADPPLVLSLMPDSRALEGGRLDHMGLRLVDTDAVRATVARLEAAGLHGRAEDQTTCCYAVQDKVWLADPDGNGWEIYAVTADVQPDSGVASDSGCCAVEPQEAAAPQVAAEPKAQTASCCA